jgi:hypothetical protein
MSITSDGVLGRVSLDTSVIMDRVFAQLAQRVASQGIPPEFAGMSPEDLIASAAADWIGRMLLPGADEPIEVRSSVAPDREPALPGYDELLERNAELAAALGACECWGDDEDCPDCYGEGGSGWLRPDRRLYAHYVHQAVKRLPPAPRRRPVGRGVAPVTHVNGTEIRGGRNDGHMDR